MSNEPVAWQVHPFDYGIGYEGVYARTDRPEQVEAWKRKGWTVQPLYTHPVDDTALLRQALEALEGRAVNRYMERLDETITALKDRLGEKT
jgi:hypothetical protein